MKKLPRVFPRKPSVGKPPSPSETAEFAAENPAQFDNRSVADFAYAMRVKLAVKRLDGRGGWQDKEQCTNEHLSQLLREHVDKGDPIDVANFCMMLHQRRERIAPPQMNVAGPGLLEIAKLAGIHGIRYPTNAAMQAFMARILSDIEREHQDFRLQNDRDWKAKVDQARVSGFTEGVEKAASIADDSAADFEKQADGKEDPHAHDALLLAADACELTADAIRAIMGGEING